jgi:hypothetical protein
MPAITARPRRQKMPTNRRKHDPAFKAKVTNPRALKRVPEWGDGWIPVVARVNEFADGVSKIKVMAREAGRDPSGLDFTAFGIEGQWQTRPQIQEFAQAGAGRVMVWLGNDDLKGMLREMERLAKAVG